jgi:hypothetical protein
MYLTPAFGGQFIAAQNGLSHWLSYANTVFSLINFIVRAMSSFYLFKLVQ